MAATPVESPDRPVDDLGIAIPLVDSDFEDASARETLDCQLNNCGGAIYSANEDMFALTLVCQMSTISSIIDEPFDI